jgi:hypothetical protein
MLVMVGARPPLPVFMDIGLQLVVWQPMFLLLSLQMPGLARAQLVLLVLVGTDMRLLARPLVVLMHVVVLVGD